MSRAHPAGPKHGDLIGNAPLPSPPAEAGELAAGVWPAGADRDSSGALCLSGVPVTEVVRRYGTPVLVLDADDLRSRARDYVRAFTDPTGRTEVTIYYAGKAFLAAAVVAWLRDEGLGMDVCSGGELACVLAAGMPAERVLFHGNNKSRDELRAALVAGVGRIVVDSHDELDRLAALAHAEGVRAPVLIRVTLGVEAHTHEFIATAHEDQKFGFSLASGSAARAVRRAASHPNLEFLGVHSHIGSQIFVSSGFEVAAHRAVRFMADLRHDHGIEVTELNLGGGMGIRYTEDDEPIDIAAMGPALLTIVRNECERAGVPVPRLAFEPGRAIVGPTTVTVYEAGTVKRRSLDGGRYRTYVSVDGGMSDNIRTALYDAEYTVTLANRVSGAPAELSRVVGKHCESGDIVIRDAWLPGDLQPGDLLAVAATGAYNRSMASNYNMVGRPPVVAVAEGRLRTVLRRETVEDMFALDPGLAPSPADSNTGYPTTPPPPRRT